MYRPNPLVQLSEEGRFRLDCLFDMCAAGVQLVLFDGNGNARFYVSCYRLPPALLRSVDLNPLFLEQFVVLFHELLKLGSQVDQLILEIGRDFIPLIALFLRGEDRQARVVARVERLHAQCLKRRLEGGNRFFALLAALPRALVGIRFEGQMKFVTAVGIHAIAEHRV
eukprot:scaffold26275_cov31-Tisochrysis_lutea.AAC.7